MTTNEKASQLAFEYLRRNTDNLSHSEFLDKYKDACEQFRALLEESEPKVVNTLDIMY